VVGARQQRGGCGCGRRSLVSGRGKAAWQSSSAVCAHNATQHTGSCTDFSRKVGRCQSVAKQPGGRRQHTLPVCGPASTAAAPHSPSHTHSVRSHHQHHWYWHVQQNEHRRPCCTPPSSPHPAARRHHPHTLLHAAIIPTPCCTPPSSPQDEPVFFNLVAIATTVGALLMFVAFVGFLMYRQILLF
jgi:hypothetical protein